MSESVDSEPPSPTLGVVILAAGQGTRMRSPTPKVLHPLAGRPMVGHVVNVTRKLKPSIIVLVVSADGDRVVEAAGPNVVKAIQYEQLGTANAMQAAKEAVCDRVDGVLMVYGDAALIQEATLQRMVQMLSQAPLVFLTAELNDPTGYGRVLRNETGHVRGVVEDRDASDAEKTIREINSGIMAFDSAWLWQHIDQIPRQPHGEYYLPDLVAIAIAEGAAVETVSAESIDEVEGVNTQAQLAYANAVIWQRERERLMAGGVTLLAPDTIFISPGVEVSAGVTIQPNTHLLGSTSVGALTEIGPNSIVRDSQIGSGCRIIASMLEEAVVHDNVQIGPFSHLRPGAVILDDVELGNYSEVKASTIGKGTRIHHFSYIGDATLGEDVNIGAGTITCNYDGTAKHQTIIGSHAFIGSDSMLIAPVEIGDNARTGAGSVVRRNVAPGQLVVGIPARPVPGRPLEPAQAHSMTDKETE
ncbi:MAG: bifunctional UDP-N-acetylglucosamine diphosphorylase/glucosamine-1-phosphate N-acetyltransferase GlmU [Chloroflexota bacterium]